MRSLKTTITSIAVSLLIVGTAPAQMVFDSSMFRSGYDIPAGIVHGTWDFDEWPGVDHDVVYKTEFLYSTSKGERIKIDYRRSAFDNDDHEGYLQSPPILRAHGVADIRDLMHSKQKKVLLGVFAHPDDEILLAGGLLSYAANRGWDVQVYLVSNGADGTKGTALFPAREIGGFNAFGIMKDGTIRVETDSAGLQKFEGLGEYSSILGISINVLPVDMMLEGQIVKQLGEIPDLDWIKSFGPESIARNAILESTRKIFDEIQPSVVVTHGTQGEYGNYLHKTVHDVVDEVVQEGRSQESLLTAFPEYNSSDRITHFIDLDQNNKRFREKKFAAFRALDFLHQPGLDYDKPWDPFDDLMDGAFAKDYGYSPVEGYPPRYEFYQLVNRISNK